MKSKSKSKSKPKPVIWLLSLLFLMMIPVFVYAAILSVWVPPGEWFSGYMLARTEYVWNHKIQTLKDFNAYCNQYISEGMLLVLATTLEIDTVYSLKTIIYAFCRLF